MWRPRVQIAKYELGSALQAEEAAQVAQIENQADAVADAPTEVSPDVAATATATNEVQANPA